MASLSDKQMKELALGMKATNYLPLLVGGEGFQRGKPLGEVRRRGGRKRVVSKIECAGGSVVTRGSRVVFHLRWVEFDDQSIELGSGNGCNAIVDGPAH
ncbi:hypothetical protein M0R45_025549 [Rubus argutus]|uniref:Uncharacterized protein n=1 Tax=Rubus argutus TaxID=59490 RepID=A0AAW1WYD7_RUBAR